MNQPTVTMAEMLQQHQQQRKQRSGSTMSLHQMASGGGGGGSAADSWRHQHQHFNSGAGGRNNLINPMVMAQLAATNPMMASQLAQAANPALHRCEYLLRFISFNFFITISGFLTKHYYNTRLFLDI